MNNTILSCPIGFDKTSMIDLLSLSVGGVISRQNRLGEIIGDSGWNADIKNGTISFGEKTFRSGVIGTESSSGGTWLWSWAHTEGGLPEIACATARRAKKLLPECPEFANGKFLLDELHTGHNLSMICCAVSEKELCYYRCPHSEGAAFVTVEGLPAEVFAPVDAQEFLRQYLEIVSGFYCDHRLLAAGFLHMNGIEFSAEGERLTANFPQAEATLDFEPCEGLYRLADIKFN